MQLYFNLVLSNFDYLAMMLTFLRRCAHSTEEELYILHRARGNSVQIAHRSLVTDSSKKYKRHLDISMKLTFYFYCLSLYRMLLANLNLNNITWQILIRVSRILICRISGQFFWPDIKQKSKYRFFLLKTLRFQQTLLTFLIAVSLLFA